MTFFRILVVGDACIDEYRYGSVRRLNPEAPVPILNYDAKPKILMGMAHNVASNLQAMGAAVDLRVPSQLSRKVRYIDAKTGYHLLRVDDDVPVETPYAVQGREAYKKYDAVVLSDYDKGFVTEAVIRGFTLVYDGPIFVDTKKTRLTDAKNLIYKINELENSRLVQAPAPDRLVITLGEKGCVYNNTTYPGYQTNVVDVCGAGDVFLASLAYGWLWFKDMARALSAANRLASISCQHVGAHTLTEQELQCVF